jgi:threonine dehydrogenase-like Zn-dependent dehydrogenase
MPDRTNTMKAVVLEAERTAVLADVERDASPLGPAEVEARTLYTLVSPGTEANLFLGEYHRTGIGWGRLPMTPGYAAVAEVERVGESVEAVRPGDLVFCMGKHQAFQRMEERALLPVPAGLEPAEAPYARIMNVTFTAYSTVSVRPPETVLVVGLGLVGLLGAQLFRMAGYRVAGAEPLESRRRIAERHGIETVLPAVPADDPVWRGKVGLVVECSAHERAAVDATWCLRRGGEIALVGVPMAAKTDVLALEAYKAVFRAGVTMRSGSEWLIPRYPDGTGRPSIWGNMARALEFLAAGQVTVDGLHTIMSPAECQETYERIIEKRLEGLTIAFDWTGMA